MWITNATIYDVCDKPILKENLTIHEPGQNLRLIYQKTVCNAKLKYFILGFCRLADIPKSQAGKYQDIFRTAMQATKENWRDKEWIEKTFQPIALLLDKVEKLPHNHAWQIRNKVKPVKENLPKKDIASVIERCMADVFRVWDQDKNDPYFPVMAQIVMSGDDWMTGENFLNVLKGLGSYEYQNMVVIMHFIRCFLMNSTIPLWFMRKKFYGICEPMTLKAAWIPHRAAFYDVNFWEHLMNFLLNYKDYDAFPESSRIKVYEILTNLTMFNVVHSQEPSETPTNHIKHPATTCLPKGDGDEPLCRLSKKDWEIKRDLGFSDYVPDIDTTFLCLSSARKWIDLHKDIPKLYNAITGKEYKEGDTLPVKINEELLAECEKFLDHKFVEIVTEYQIGSGYETNPPTIQITKPLDYYGAVPIWWDKKFKKEDGEVREVLGNEICPGHNMDVFESILINRKQWNALKSPNLETVQRLLQFHYNAFTSGNFKHESALKYYLPQIYVYYFGRVYDVWITLSDEEKSLIDPSNEKVEKIREIAIEWVKDYMIGFTMNAFDASLAVSSLVLLKYPNKEDGMIATALKKIKDSVGEGKGGHPFLAYEWNKMRHPSRILVGSPVSTTLFVLNALILANTYLYSN